MAVMMERRALLRIAAVAGLLGPAALSAGCASPPPAAAGTLAGSGISRAPADATTIAAALRSVVGPGGTAFGRSLGAGVPGNAVFSPYSLVAALAMTRLGAGGATAKAMDATLGVTDPAALSAGMNAVAQALGRRAGERKRLDGSSGTLTWHEANSLWAQTGLSWEQSFLDQLARFYGSGMWQVDYAKDPEAARRAINQWTAGQTHDLIRDLVPAGLLSADTRLTLVNALYLKAPWEFPFEPKGTQDAPFTRGDGSSIRVPTMRRIVPGSYASGKGWTAAALPYLGRELAMALILPDRGGEAAVRSAVTGLGLSDILAALRPNQVDVALPRFAMRTHTGLRDILSAMGMEIAFSPQADFSGMTRSAPLAISDVIQEAVIAVDEQGTEAAAATAVVMLERAAAPAGSVLTLDRPFYAVVYDVATGVPLFLAHVNDPLARS